MYINPIQNKWFNKLSYLSEQIYVRVIWKSDMNVPFVVISTNRKAVFEDFYKVSKFLIWPNFKQSCSFLVRDPRTISINIHSYPFLVDQLELTKTEILSLHL
jgi:hypothetical protein